MTTLTCCYRRNLHLYFSATSFLSLALSPIGSCSHCEFFCFLFSLSLPFDLHGRATSRYLSFSQNQGFELPIEHPLSAAFLFSSNSRALHLFSQPSLLVFLGFCNLTSSCLHFCSIALFFQFLRYVLEAYCSLCLLSRKQTLWFQTVISAPTFAQFTEFGALYFCYVV